MRPKRTPVPEQAGWLLVEADMGFNRRPWEPWRDFEQGRDLVGFSLCLLWANGQEARRQWEGLDIQVRGVEGCIALSLIFVSITQENEARFFS